VQKRLDDRAWQSVIGDEVNFHPAGVDPRMVETENDTNTGLVPACELESGGSDARAFPGIRQLELARRLGDQAVVGSICAPDGYAHTLDLLVDRMRELFPK